MSVAVLSSSLTLQVDLSVGMRGYLIHYPTFMQEGSHNATCSCYKGYLALCSDFVMDVGQCDCFPSATICIICDHLACNHHLVIVNNTMLDAACQIVLNDPITNMLEVLEACWPRQRRKYSSAV